MASTAEQVVRDLLAEDGRGLFAGMMPRSVGRNGDVDMLTARALASVGLAGLLGLPSLMLASTIVHAPLAGPAAISLGYLAAAHALAFGAPRRAGAWTLAVLSGFVLWTALALLAGEATLSWPGLAAVALAPLFAAAPALTRRLANARADPVLAAARRDIACLDRLTPEEAMLIVDRSGQVLSGTRSGLDALGLDATDADVTRRVHSADAAILLDALARCGAAPLDVPLRVQRAESDECRLAAALTADDNDTVRVKLRAAPAEACSGGPGDNDNSGTLSICATPPPQTIISAACCDVGEAMAFALRHVAPRARSLSVDLVCDDAPAVVAACDRQLGRRILILLLEEAMRRSHSGAEIHLSAKGLKGAVLLRTVAPGGTEVECEPADLTALAAVVDQVGGSLVAARSGAATVLSVRLALASSAMTDRPNRTGEI